MDISHVRLSRGKSYKNYPIEGERTNWVRTLVGQDLREYRHRGRWTRKTLLKKDAEQEETVWSGVSFSDRVSLSLFTRSNLTLCPLSLPYTITSCPPISLMLS